MSETPDDSRERGEGVAQSERRELKFHMDPLQSLNRGPVRTTRALEKTDGLSYVQVDWLFSFCRAIFISGLLDSVDTPLVSSFQFQTIPWRTLC